MSLTRLKCELRKRDARASERKFELFQQRREGLLKVIHVTHMLLSVSYV